MSQLDTTPLTVDFGSLEVGAVTVDSTNMLPTGVTPVSATPTLMDATLGVSAASVITQTTMTGNKAFVTLSHPMRNHTYELLVAWLLNSGETRETRTLVNVPA